MDFIALSFSTYNFSLEVVHIVCEDASQDRDEDVEEADDDVGFSDLGAGEAETDHVKVDEGVDEGETNGLEEEQQLDIEHGEHSADGTHCRDILQLSCVTQIEMC